MSFTALFLSLYFLFQKKFKDDGYLFLYLSVIVLSYEAFYKTLIHSRLIVDFVYAYIPGRFFNLLIYPIFLLFVWTVTKKNFRMKLSHKLLLCTFIIYSIYVFIYSLLIPTNTKLEMLHSFYSDGRPGPFNYWSNPETLLKSTLIPLIFMVVIVLDFFKFRLKYTTVQSKRLINILSVVIGSYFIFNQLANPIYSWFFELTNISMIEWTVDIIFLTFIIFLLCIISLMVNTGSSFLPKSKYSTSSLEINAYNELIANARIAIERDTLFKNENLTLKELADKLGTNPKYLSQAINDHLKISYVDFVNEYRVRDSEKQLLDIDNNLLTLEAIGFNAGFKSKSTFFRVFKKMNGQTPKQFIQAKRSSNA